MCECFNEVEKIAKEKILEQAEKSMGGVHEAKNGHFDNISFSLKDSDMKTIVVLPYKQKIRLKRNDGKPCARDNTFTFNVVASFCPLCGEKQNV